LAQWVFKRYLAPRERARKFEETAMADTGMTAIAVEGGKGPAEALHPVQIARPVPAEGEILIAVRAAGVNRPDLLQRMGFYPPARSFIQPVAGARVIGCALSWVVAAMRSTPSATPATPCRCRRD